MPVKSATKAQSSTAKATKVHVEFPPETAHFISKAICPMVKNSAYPIYSMLRIESSGNNSGVIITAVTDQSRLQTVYMVNDSITSRVNIVGDFDDPFLVPAAQLSSIIDAGTVERDGILLKPDSTGKVEAVLPDDNAKYTLLTMPCDDFPEWAERKTDPTKIAIKAGDLQTSLKAVMFAIPKKDHRRVIMGACLEICDWKLRLTATDGKKLARLSVPIVGDGADLNLSSRFTLPLVEIANILRILSQFDWDKGSDKDGEKSIPEVVNIEFDNCQMLLSARNFRYYCNGIEGKYPDCDAVIPKDAWFYFQVEREKLMKAVSRSMIMIDSKDKAFIINPDTETTLKLESYARDVGNHTGFVAIKYERDSERIPAMAFNAALMREMLSNMDGEIIHVAVKTPGHPVIFTQDDISREENMSLLMPIKLADAYTAAVEDKEEEVDGEITAEMVDEMEENGEE